jgi:putative oxidoreductase
MTGDEYNFALLVLRVTFGLMMFAHGYNHFFRGGRIPGTGRWFESLGMRPGRLHAIFASTTEVVAGLMFAAGLLTPFAAAGFVGLMAVAIATLHRKNGFFIVKEGWEYTGLIAVVAVCVSLLGPGEWSLDDAFGIADDLSGWTGVWISLLLGLGAAGALLAVYYRPPKPAEA